MPNTEHHTDRAYHADETPDVSDISNPDVTHERSDVNVRAISWFILGLGVFFFVVYVAMLLLFDAFDDREAADEPPPRSLVGVSEQRLPPEPRLQLAPGHETSPIEDHKTLQAEMNKRLNSYGWVDQPMRIVHIPIEEAKEILLEQAGKQGREEQRGRQNATMPSDASSGKKPELRAQ
ncbi:MAG: hypothetical protein AB7U82_04805 [Blastocatellales bacterium]